MKTLVISDSCAAELSLALADASTPSPTPAPTPTPTPSPDTSGYARVHLIDLRWGPVGTGNVSVFTKDWGGFGHNEAVAVRFTTPAVPQSNNTSLGRIAAAAYVDQPLGGRSCSLSRTPYDFTNAIDSADTAGVQFSVGVLVTRSGVTYRRLECGTVYYFNIRNERGGVSTCAPGQSANMIVQLYKPAGL